MSLYSAMQNLLDLDGIALWLDDSPDVLYSALLSLTCGQISEDQKKILHDQRRVWCSICASVCTPDAVHGHGSEQLHMPSIEWALSQSDAILIVAPLAKEKTWDAEWFSSQRPASRWTSVVLAVPSLIETWHKYASHVAPRAEIVDHSYLDERAHRAPESVQ
jgi:hypothetical protein